MNTRSKSIIRKVKKVLKYTIFATNLIAIILLIFSTQASKIDPSIFVFASYIGISFPFLFAINLVYLVYWIITFRWRFILVQIIAFMFCADAISTYFPFNKQTVDIPKGTITLMTYNVRGFDWLTGKEARENPVLDYLANSGADIICMQEFAVEQWQDREKIISLSEFDNVMHDYPYRTIIRLGDTNSSTIYGLACYSKYPIRKVARIPLDSYFNGSGMYEIRVGDDDLVIVNNHLESNRITAEDKELFKELVEKKDRTKINDAVESVFKRLDPAFKTKGKQADIISHQVEVQREKNPKMIVLGDFNDTSMSYTYRTMKGNLIDSFKATGKGMGITYHEDHFLFRIDFIMYTPNIKSYNCTVDHVKYSDHYPVTTLIKL